jgi:hypothetical protein
MQVKGDVKKLRKLLVKELLLELLEELEVFVQGKISFALLEAE